MSIARIVWIVGLLAAVVLSFVDMSHGGFILMILGAISGWFVDKEHRLGLLIAAIFLMSGGAGAWGAIPELGGHVTAILTSIGAVLSAAGVMAVLRRLIERLLLNKGTAN